ncbi:MAG: hypothetical protein ACYDA8_00400 [Deferrisomatales bacterium]
MIRRKIALAGTLAVLFAGPSMAAQTGGLATPLGPGGFATSATLAYAERDVRDGRDDEVAAFRALLRAQVGALDGLDVYGTVGLSDLEFDRVDFEGALGESLGLGLRYGMLNFPEQAVKLVLDLQGEYFRSRDGSKKVRHQGGHVATYLVKEVGAAGRVGYVNTYGGVRVSYAWYEGSGGVDDYRGDDFVGLFGGADYFVTPNVFFSGELHLFDEFSAYLGVGYRF